MMFFYPTLKRKSHEIHGTSMILPVHQLRQGWAPRSLIYPGIQIAAEKWMGLQKIQSHQHQNRHSGSYNFYIVSNHEHPEENWFGDSCPTNHYSLSRTSAPSCPPWTHHRAPALPAMSQGNHLCCDYSCCDWVRYTFFVHLLYNIHIYIYVYVYAIICTTNT